jgi:TonB family protein
MPFFLDTQETVQRFGGSIAEFRSLLDTNYIRHGSPLDLFEFATTLENSNQFRLDLSALVKSIVKREKEEILLTDMLSIIAASVGGESVLETNADITKPTNAIMEFLLGTGCWKRFGLSSRPVSPTPARAVTQSEVPPVRPSVRKEEPRSIPTSSLAKTASGTEKAEDRTNLLGLSHELRETLARLESNTQQVKIHLDSIEKRINNIEPSPDAESARASGLEPLLHRGNVGAVDGRAAHLQTAPPPEEDIPLFGAKFSNSNRAVFSRPPHIEIEEDDFSSPTFAYGSEKERSLLPVGVFLLVVAIIVAAFFFFRSGKGEALLASGRSHLDTPGAPSSDVPAAASGEAAGVSRTPAASAPGAAAALAVKDAARSDTTDNKSVNPAVSGREDSGPQTEGQATTDNSEVKYVQSQVMEGHLISAPRPEYPTQARIDHIEGQVALQATISRSGSIQTLHVIKGPAVLRSAAIDAVRHWRYRPYSVDGQAVKVATTIYVDFNLRPPTVVH